MESVPSVAFTDAAFASDQSLHERSEKDKKRRKFRSSIRASRAEKEPKLKEKRARYWLSKAKEAQTPDEEREADLAGFASVLDSLKQLHPDSGLDVWTCDRVLYLPTALHGRAVLVEHFPNIWLLTNEQLREKERRKYPVGVFYTRTKDINDKIWGKWVKWGQLVFGVHAGDNWLACEAIVEDQEKFGYRLGETVLLSSAHDLGNVIGFTEENVVVQFPKAAWPVKPEDLEHMGLDGKWKSLEKGEITIDGVDIIFSVDDIQFGARLNEIRVRHDSIRVFEMDFLGNLCIGELAEDGKIHWSDGDVWSRICGVRMEKGFSCDWGDVSQACDWLQMSAFQGPEEEEKEEEPEPESDPNNDSEPEDEGQRYCIFLKLSRLADGFEDMEDVCVPKYLTIGCENQWSMELLRRRLIDAHHSTSNCSRLAEGPSYMVGGAYGRKNSMQLRGGSMTSLGTLDMRASESLESRAGGRSSLTSAVSEASAAAGGNCSRYTMASAASMNSTTSGFHQTATTESDYIDRSVGFGGIETGNFAKAPEADYGRVSTIQSLHHETSTQALGKKKKTQRKFNPLSKWKKVHGVEHWHGAATIGKSRTQKTREEYDTLYRKYQKIHSHKLQNNQKHPLPAGHAAPKVAHILWPHKTIIKTVAQREHFVFKLFLQTPQYTRVERYSMFITSMLVCFFFMTFLFSADCWMEPKPGFCIKPKPGWFRYYFGWLIPSWSLVFASIFSIIVGSFPPFILSMFFRKIPVRWILDEDEKQAQRRWWWFFMGLGWTITLSLQMFIMYWLIVFAHQYDWLIFRKFLNSMLQGFIHRLFTSPVGRMCPIAMSLIGAKYCACCDAFLVFCCLHHIPIEKMAFRKNASNDDETKGDEGDDDIDDTEEAGDVGEDGGGVGLAHFEII
jgi:hypothetical protein